MALSWFDLQIARAIRQRQQLQVFAPQTLPGDPRLLCSLTIEIRLLVLCSLTIEIFGGMTG